MLLQFCSTKQKGKNARNTNQLQPLRSTPHSYDRAQGPKYLQAQEYPSKNNIVAPPSFGASCPRGIIARSKMETRQKRVKSQLPR